MDVTLLYMPVYYFFSFYTRRMHVRGHASLKSVLFIWLSYRFTTKMVPMIIALKLEIVIYE